MKITYEQFVRGIAAINGYRDLLKKVYLAFQEAGEQRIDSLGGDGLLSELTRQLEERCNDSCEPNGSMIEYMLYECGGPVRLEDGREFMTRTPEELWAYWEAVGEGPFSAHPVEKGAGS